MSDILNFPIEKWSEENKRRAYDMTNDYYLTKDPAEDDNLDLPAQDVLDKLKENLRKDIQYGEFGEWLKQFKED